MSVKKESELHPGESCVYEFYSPGFVGLNSYRGHRAHGLSLVGLVEVEGLMGEILMKGPPIQREA